MIPPGWYLCSWSSGTHLRVDAGDYTFVNDDGTEEDANALKNTLERFYDKGWMTLALRSIVPVDGL